MKLIFSAFLFLLVGVTTANAQTPANEDFCKIFASVAKQATVYRGSERIYTPAAGFYNAGRVLLRLGQAGDPAKFALFTGTCVDKGIKLRLEGGTYTQPPAELIGYIEADYIRLIGNNNYFIEIDPVV